MQLLKAAVELSHTAYRSPEAVKRLAGLLGLSRRSSEVSMCIGGAALLHKDVEAAQRVCLQLIRKDHMPAWRLCAAVMRAGGDEVGSMDTHVKLLSFAACYCPAKRVSLVRHMLGLFVSQLWCVPCHATPCHAMPCVLCYSVTLMLRSALLHLR